MVTYQKIAGQARNDDGLWHIMKLILLEELLVKKRIETLRKFIEELLFNLEEDKNVSF